MKQLLQISESSVWRVRDMRIVLPARALSAAGQNMAMVALVLHMHDSGPGVMATAALFGCLAIPSIAFMSLAGRVADHSDSRRILALGHLGEAAAVLGLAAATLGAPWWACLPLVCAMQSGAAFANPVWSALVPRIVGDDRIGQAISWQQGLSTAIAPTGAAISGIVYGLAGPAPALGMAALLIATLATSALLVHTRRRPSPAGTAAGDSADHSRGGLAILRRDALLWPLFISLFVLVLGVEGVNVVEVFLARDELGATPEQYGFTEMCFSVGAVAGALVTGRFTKTRSRVWVCLVGFGGTAITLVAAGLAPNFWVYLAAVSVIGFASASGNAATGALVMSRVADAVRGRVSSTISGVTRAASIVALVLGGLAGTLLGPRATFVTGGAVGVIVVLTALLRTRRPPDRPGCLGLA